MRIRNRSGALFTSASCIAINNGHDGNGEEFLLPLVEAVMDVQRREDNIGEEEDHGTHKRSAHNGRNALHLQRGGAGNTESQALQHGGEGKKADCIWKGSMRNQCHNIDIGLFAEKEIEQEGLLKESTQCSAEKGMLGGGDEDWKLPKSGGLEMGTLWRQQKYLDMRAVKRKRSKHVIGNISEGKHETNTTKKFRLETDIQQEDGRKLDEKAMPINRRYSNEAEGSQCRRRNGRGWQCPQRTLVGYSLCEYHLSKGRLRSINSNSKNTGRVIVNNKAGSCRFKELRLIDAS